MWDWGILLDYDESAKGTGESPLRGRQHNRKVSYGHEEAAAIIFRNQCRSSPREWGGTPISAKGSVQRCRKTIVPALRFGHGLPNSYLCLRCDSVPQMRSCGIDRHTWPQGRTALPNTSTRLCLKNALPRLNPASRNALRQLTPTRKQRR